MRHAVFIITVFLLFFYAAPSIAQRGFNHCDDAKHSGDVLTCINTHHSAITQELNTTYEALLDEQSEENAQSLRDTQTGWIAYRDQECAWEAEQADTQSLQRIEKLSCLTNLTEQRHKLLKDQLNTIEESHNIDKKKYRSATRWINVLADEHPNIFWRYGEQISVDLDCDGQNEEAILGQSVKLKDEDSAQYDVKTFIAISENPKIGRPSAQLLEFTQEAPALCDPNVALSMTNYPKTEATAEETGEKPDTCSHALLLKSANCPTSTLLWDENLYVIKEQ